MSEQVKISLKNHLSHLKAYAFVLLISSVIIMYNTWLGEQYRMDSLVIVYAFMLGYGGLVLYLHLEYYFENRGVVLTFENDHIIYSKGGVDNIISSEDIIKVERVCSRSLSMNQRQLLPTDIYHYIKITLRDNSVFIITSLLYPKFSHKWPVVVDEKVRIIPFVD